ALMRKFGESIGMAFQIQDDILDYTRTACTGKPSNNDLREHKVTLPLLTVLESVGEERRRELLARLARCHEEDEPVEYLQHIVENEGGMEKAARVM
ncbi:polyprenyl synthetase family protein, partial [Alistipes putredinis]|uniref:polyprenyl synthetase family protein n=1 Tax=Alistipes putredinis TaxID=28117 RepID=UPI0023B11616